MDFTKLFKNEVEVGEDKLMFNTLAEGEIVVKKVEDGEPSFYTGTFTHEGFDYEVEDGNINSVLELEKEPEVELEVYLTDSIDAINLKVDNFIETVTGLFESIKPKEEDNTLSVAINDLATKFEEVKLELKQQSAEAEAKEGEITDTEVQAFNVEAFKAASNWSKSK